MFGAVALYFPQMLFGLAVTLAVAAGSLLLGLIIAMVGAPASLYGPKVVQRLVACDRFARNSGDFVCARHVGQGELCRADMRGIVRDRARGESFGGR